MILATMGHTAPSQLIWMKPDKSFKEFGDLVEKQRFDADKTEKERTIFLLRMWVEASGQTSTC